MTAFKPQVEVSCKAQATILRCLDQIPGRKKGMKPGVIGIVCPFHPDTDPSCMLNVAQGERGSIGFHYCLGCGHKGGWNDIADKLGLERIEEKDFKQDRMVQRNKEQLRANLLGINESSGNIELIAKGMNLELMIPFPADLTWRRIKGALLSKLKCMLAFDYMTENKAILFPVVVNGTLVGCIKGQWKKVPKVPSYITSRGDKWNSRECLFPFDYSVKMALKQDMCLVLTEGPRDALRLLGCKVPAVCINGAKSWSKQKLSLIVDSGVKGVVICMDSDSAGVSASNAIRRMIKPVMDVFVFRMAEVKDELQRKAKTEEQKERWSKVDPYSMPLRFVEDLLEMCQ